MQSKFSYFIVFPLFIVLFISGFLFFTVRDILHDHSPAVLLVHIIDLPLLLFVLVWAFFGELRTKAILIIIDKKNIDVKTYLGLGKTRQYYTDEFDGYCTSILSSRVSKYEYLYLMKDDKKCVKISSFYHRNYDELKGYLAENLSFIGEHPYSLAEEIKEIIQ